MALQNDELVHRDLPIRNSLCFGHIGKSLWLKARGFLSMKLVGWKSEDFEGESKTVY